MTTPASIAVQRVPYFAGRGRIEWRERPVPVPQSGELLVEVRANALCGTDRQLLRDGSDVTPGHEAAGVVAAGGPGTSTASGTPGVIYLMDYCGGCRSCAAGATNQCTAKRADMGFTRDGGLGRWMLVHETNFFPVPPGLDLADATLLLDLMGTSSHAIGRALALRSDVATMLVAGAGPVGLGVVVMARLLLGPTVTVLATDRVPFRLDLAHRMGAVAVPNDRPVGAALAELGHDAPDVAIDTSGSPSLRRLLLEALGPRGVLVCVGHGGSLEVDVSRELIGPERALIGSEYFRFDELPGNLELLLGHRGLFGGLVTHRFGIDRLEEAYRVFEMGQTGKVVVVQ